MIYTKTADSYAFESAAFGNGRIVADGNTTVPNYYITDHLGSVRVVVDGQGNDIARNDYYAFGKRHVNPLLATSASNRWLYNGKEDQTTGALGLLDFGWRMYNPEWIRWFNSDPLAEISRRISPYVYALNNPVKYIDLYGLAPYYDLDGNYLGDDNNQEDLTRYIITDNQEKRQINRGKVSLDSASSRAALPSDAVLSESLDVLTRTAANGGKREESSIVMKNGTVVKGETGPEAMEGIISATLPSLPPGTGATDVEATIHSHGTAFEFDEGLNITFTTTATKLGPDDPQIFANYSTNIIVGPLGDAIPGQKSLTNSISPIQRPLGIAIYNGASQTPRLQLKQSTVEKILGK